MPHEKYQSCIDVCNDCMVACEHCATECLHEQDVKMMARAASNWIAPAPQYARLQSA